MKAGSRVRFRAGKNKGKLGTILKLNGSNAIVVVHEDDEIAVRDPGDMARTAPVYIVKKTAARLVGDLVYPYLSYIEDEKKS